MSVATVYNGSSFVARSLNARLGKLGYGVVIAYRGSRYIEEKYKIIGGPGQVYFAPYHLKDEKSLRESMEHSNIVINCIGKHNETRNFSWEDVHVKGPRLMAKLARECGVKKFIHISALNASPNPEPKVLKNGSQFYRSKYYGELAVREEFPDAIIFRPSDIAGERDSFINHFTELMRSRYTRKLAIWDYYDGVVKQPVWVNDLVSGIVNSIKDSSADGKTFQAVGPYRYDFYSLIEYMKNCAGTGPKYDNGSISNLRWDPFRLVISIGEKVLKSPGYTWERVERDCTTDYVDKKLPTLEDLGVSLTPLELHLSALAFNRPRIHRVEIPYESKLDIPQPVRLNA